jgi:hypothetical protein
MAGEKTLAPPPSFSHSSPSDSIPQQLPPTWVRVLHPALLAWSLPCSSRCDAVRRWFVRPLRKNSNHGWAELRAQGTGTTRATQFHNSRLKVSQEHHGRRHLFCQSNHKTQVIWKGWASRSGVTVPMGPANASESEIRASKNCVTGENWT